MKKRLYLYRLMIVVTVLLVPLAIFCLVLWQRSFTELKYTNQKYYESMLDNFGDVVNAKIEDLKNHAADLIASSKEKDSIFWEANKLFSDNSYWYKEAVEEIKDQHFCTSVGEWGIYLYSADRMITTKGTMSSEDYLKLTLNVSMDFELLRDWFSEKNFEYQRELLATTNTAGEINGKMLLGFMVKIGKTQDKALLFYVMERADFKTFINAIYGENGINFYISGKASDDIYLSLITDYRAVPEFLQNKNGTKEEMYDSIYTIQDEVLPLTYAIQVTEDSFQNSIISFYHDTKSILYLAMLLALCICGVVLYFAYKPIYLLTESLDYEGGNEFLTFRSALENKHTQISEQRMMIMDLLINNLVTGLPISEEKLALLGIPRKRQFYCVMFLDNHVLSVREVEELTKELEEKLRCKLFVTDWEGEKESILIVFMEEDNCRAIIEAMSLWASSNLTDDINLRVGKVVHSLDEIKLSYASCRNEKERKNAKNDATAQQKRQERQRKQQEEIMEYIDAHFCDEDLSQTQIADEFQISVYTLSRMFRNQVGIGFTDYVNGKRIEYSKELLLTTEDAVKDISLKVGYVNVNYFCKIFKNTVGVSPGDFRTSIK